MSLGLELVKKAYEKQIDERLFQMWNLNRLFMTEENFQSFKEYKSKALNKKDVPKPVKPSKEDIIFESQKIISAWKGSK